MDVNLSIRTAAPDRTSGPGMNGQPAVEVESASPPVVTKGINEEVNCANRAITVSGKPLYGPKEMPYRDASNETIRQLTEEAVRAWTGTVAEKLEINPELIEPLLPRIVSCDEMMRLRAECFEREMLKMFTGAKKELIRSLPHEMKYYFSQTTLALAYGPDEIALIKRKKPPVVNLLGGYMSKFYVLAVNEDGVRSGQMSPFELGAHEGNHGLCALFRSLLTEEDLNSEIITGLKEEITNGAIYTFGDAFKTHPLYIPSSNMRNKVAAFLEELIRNGKNDDRVSAEVFDDNGLVFEVPKLNEKGKHELLEIAKKYSDFMETCSEKDSTAVSVLSNLVNRQMLRFGLAKGILPIQSEYSVRINQDVFEKLPKDKIDKLREALYSSPKAKEFALSAAKNLLSMVEGNGGFQAKQHLGLTPNLTEAVMYTFCPEEQDCYKAGAVCGLAGEPTPESEVRLHATLELFDLGKKYVEKLQTVSVSPQDLQSVKKSTELLAVRIEHSEKLRTIEKIIDTEISLLKSRIPNLSELLKEEQAIRYKHQKYFIASDEFMSPGEQERLNDLQEIRLKIQDLLENNQIHCKHFVEALKEEKEFYETIKSLQEGVKAEDVNPVKRCLDENLISELRALEKQMAEKQKIARMPALENIFRPECLGKTVVVTEGEIDESELPADIQKQAA